MHFNTTTRLPLRESGSRTGFHGHPRRCVHAAASKPTYYDVLGVDVDASEEDIKAAYRRKAKELHPDVSKMEDAEEQFKACKVAYETLVDAGRRQEYDSLNRTRRLNFFQDVDESELRQGWPSRGTVDPWEVHRRMWEGEEARTASTSGRDGSSGDGSEQQQQQQEVSPEEFLERLSRVMGGGWGSPMASPFGDGGRLDPFGSSSSEAWHRRVNQQTNNPGFGYRGRPVYGSDDSEGWGGRPSAPSEWNPYRPGDDSFEKREGWVNPGRQEWQAPRRRWEEEEGEGLGGRGGSTRGPGRGGIPGDGGFLGKPL